MNNRFVMLCWLFGGQTFLLSVQSYENIALHKKAWLRNASMFGLSSADLAVDGRKSNLLPFGGECTVSTSSYEAEWRVDLEQILSIHHIVIQFATTNKSWNDDNKDTGYLLGFSVYLSNTTNKQDGVICFQDKTFTRSTIPNPVSIPCPYHGRYVIYYNSRTHRPYPDGYSLLTGIELCEVEVYGCSWGHYGFNCENNCSVDCIGTCDVITGACHWVQRDEQRFVVAAVSVTALVIIIIVGVFKRVWLKRRKHGLRQKCIQTRTAEAGTHVAENRDESNIDTYVNVEGWEGLELTDRSVRDDSFINKNIAKPERRKATAQACTSKTLINDNDNDDDVLDLKFEKHVTYENMSDISIEELQNLIPVIKQNNDGRFKTEYDVLALGKKQTIEVGNQQENLPKNRYKRCATYDHSRVILKGKVDSSDYINANYIYDNREEIAYIATQGPKDNTVEDFWIMVWQENVTQIVILTNLKEGGKVKCTQYWPECLTSDIHGNISIANVSETSRAFYIIRKFVLLHKQESRVVMQYHYTMWPDHGTPDPLCLMVFHSHVLRTRRDDDMAPMVVHCSAGVGRTGTYIALDALYKEGKMTGRINVVEYVKVMRSCRMNMVQTYEQYTTIFIALNEEFKAFVEIQSLTNFIENVDSFIKLSEKQTTVREEFKKLLQIRPEYTSDDYKMAGNYLVNKEDKVLPLDKYLLLLTSPVTNRGSYINAIRVSSYLQDNAFIVTQYPAPEDAVAFLRLLIDHESGTVICMDPLSDIESAIKWMPESSSVRTVTPFNVQLVSKRDTDVTVTNLRILGKDDLSHPVVIVEPRGIIKPEESQQDTSLLSLVFYALSISTEGPITIVSRDGASLCGVFCAVFNSVQQIRMEDSVDVFTTVRQLQTRRPEFCSNLDEYCLVYRALRDYIETTSKQVYCNF